MIFKVQYVRIMVEELVFLEAHFRVLIKFVISYFEDAIVIIDMASNDIVEV
jgi:hypothetical protein